MNKFRLWLIAHGIEVEADDPGHVVRHAPRRGSISRQISIAINHRYYGVVLEFEVFRGVYTDELNTPHKDIAAQYEEGKR